MTAGAQALPASTLAGMVAMKLLVNRAALVEALGLASSVVLARTPKPVLNCVKLVAGATGNTKTLTVVEAQLVLKRIA